MYCENCGFPLQFIWSELTEDYFPKCVYCSRGLHAFSYYHAREERLYVSYGMYSDDILIDLYDLYARFAPRFRGEIIAEFSSRYVSPIVPPLLPSPTLLQEVLSEFTRVFHGLVEVSSAGEGSAHV